MLDLEYACQRLGLRCSPGSPGCAVVNLCPAVMERGKVQWLQNAGLVVVATRVVPGQWHFPPGKDVHALVFFAFL